MSGYPQGPQPYDEFGLTPHGQGQSGAPQGQHGTPQGQPSAPQGQPGAPQGQPGYGQQGGYSGQPAGYSGQPQQPTPPGYGPQSAASASYPGGPVPPAGPPPKKKSPLGLVLGLIGGFVVLAILAMVGVIVFVINNKPDEMAEKYFAALAAGNATEALSYSSNDPIDKSLLTDEVLKKSNELGAITDVVVQSSTSRSVTVSMKIGGTVDEVTYGVTKVDGEWKMTDAAFQVRMMTVGTENAPLLVNGVKPGATGQMYLFPGTYEFGTGTKNLAWTEPKKVFTGGMVMTPMAGMRVEMTDEGKEAARTAIREWLKGCAAKKELEPAGCPFRLKTSSFNGTPDTNTIKWTIVGDPAARWQPQLLTDPREVRGLLPYTVRLQFNYTRGAEKQSYDQRVTLSTTVKADMTTDPPKLSYGN
ncbi:hypothetical protein [Microlunatus sp. Y2014]|uniref:hypothetical protein n=1 Tax=Microlunatus sp. Y2014 TaxID=3418488 RepID=UPI003DA722E9